MKMIYLKDCHTKRKVFPWCVPSCEAEDYEL